MRPEIPAEDMGYTGMAQTDPQTRQTGDGGIEVVKARTRPLDAAKVTTLQKSLCWGYPLCLVDPELEHAGKFPKAETTPSNDGQSSKCRAQNVDEWRGSPIPREQFWYDCQQEIPRHMSLEWPQDRVLQALPLALDLSQRYEGNMIQQPNQSGSDLLDHVASHQDCSDLPFAGLMYGGYDSYFSGQSADGSTQHQAEASPGGDGNWSSSYVTSWWGHGLLDGSDGLSDNTEPLSSIDEREFPSINGPWVDECKTLNQYQETPAETSVVAPGLLLMSQPPFSVPSVLSEYMSYQSPARIEGFAMQGEEAHLPFGRHSNNNFVSQLSSCDLREAYANQTSPMNGQPDIPLEEEQKTPAAADSPPYHAGRAGDCTRDMLAQSTIEYNRHRRQVRISPRPCLPKPIHPKFPSDNWVRASNFGSRSGWSEPTSPRSINHVGRATLRRSLKDQFLIESKLAGMSYKDIREKGHFSEAESTLRGRFRTLTKEKQHRVRKPEWQEEDILLLRQAVETLLPSVHQAQGSSGYMNKGVKIPWKQVAEYIAKHGGSYHFGNATCRKKWDEINQNRRVE